MRSTETSDAELLASTIPEIGGLPSSLRPPRAAAASLNASLRSGPLDPPVLPSERSPQGKREAAEWAASIGSEEAIGNIMSVMTEYYRLMNKDAREDKKIASMSKTLQLSATRARIDAADKKLDLQVKEANEKFDEAEHAAITGLVSTIASVVAKGLFGTAAGDFVKGCGDSLKAHFDAKANYGVDARGESKAAEKQENAMTLLEKQAETQATKDDDSAKATAAARDRIRDLVFDLARKLGDTKFDILR